MRFLVDMNLSPSLPDLLGAAGYDATHWSAIGDPRAEDSDILAYARAHGYVVLTHDLDFGAILASTEADCPSVLQVRTQDVTPKHLAPILITAIRHYEDLLEKGALVTCDEWRVRSRILPIRRG